MKKISSKNKETTIDDLAMMVARGFNEMNTKIDKEIGEVKKEIREVKDRLGNVEDKLENVEENLNATRMDVLGIGDRFVSKHEFSQHLVRFSLLEQRVKTKK